MVNNKERKHNLNTAAPKAIPQKPNAESKFLRNQSIKVTELGQ